MFPLIISIKNSTISISRKEVNLLVDKTQNIVKYDCEYTPRIQVSFYH